MSEFEDALRSAVIQYTLLSHGTLYQLFSLVLGIWGLVINQKSSRRKKCRISGFRHLGLDLLKVCVCKNALKLDRVHKFR